MPTDLTGTPTSLGIGTFNTSADAPSGLGFNAAMAQIDALIAARVLKPAAGAAGDVPVWDGSTWVWPSGTRDGTKFLRDDGSWQAISIPSGSPTGVIVPFAGSAAPSGWLLANGSEQPRATYAALDAVIGTTYGAYTNGSGGAGTTHLRLPDLQGRMVAGKGPNASVSALGASDGQAAANRRPQHQTSKTLGISDPGHAHSYQSTGSNGVNQAPTTAGWFPDSQEFGNTTGSSFTGISLTGGVGTGVGTDATDAPSYIVLNYIIKT